MVLLCENCVVGTVRFWEGVFGGFNYGGGGHGLGLRKGVDERRRRVFGLRLFAVIATQV